MARKKEEQETTAPQTKVIDSKGILGDILQEKAFRESHLNFTERVDWKISSGSLKLDIYLGGGITPSLLRICGQNNEGKASPLWEKVLTPNGWTTMETLKQGSMVIGSDGKPHQVLAVYPQGKKQVFKVEFSDETSVVCCGEHLWLTKDVGDRLNNRHGTVKTTSFIHQTLKHGVHKGQWNHTIPYINPVHFTSVEEKYLLHPYVLGVLLGDGHFHYPSLTSADEEIANLVSKFLPNGVKLIKSSNKEYGYYLNSEMSSISMQEIFRRLGLLERTSCNKFVPEQYLLGSIQTRTEILQGLLDTDGSVFNNRNGQKCSTIEYTTCSPQLCDDVLFLVRSLGGRATYKTRYTNYTYQGEKRKGQLSYRIRISFHNNIVPFKLSRKLNGYTSRSSEVEKYIIGVEKAGEEDCVCIKVDSHDSLYVANGFNLTHNSPQALEILRQFLITVPNSKGFWVVAEGRGLSEENKERCGLKFVYNPAEWEIGTVFILESNIYELFINAVKRLVKNNVENIKYCFVVDSIDGLTLQTDIAKDISDANMVAGVPRLSKKMLQNLSLGMFKFGHLMILISQVTAAIQTSQYERMPNRGGEFSGGNSLLHGADWIFEFQKTSRNDYIYDTNNGQWSKENPDAKTIGKVAKVIIQKSSLEASRYHLVTYPIKFGRKPSGVWLEKEIIDKLIYLTLLERKASWLAWEESLWVQLQAKFPIVERQIQGEHNLSIYLEKNPEIRDFLYKIALSSSKAILSQVGNETI